MENMDDERKNTTMRVFKFGGASVKDAAAVRNVSKVLAMFPDENIVIVISAMGKTTNALEEVVEAYVRGEGGVLETARRRYVDGARLRDYGIATHSKYLRNVLT